MAAVTNERIIAEALRGDLSLWAGQCHAASLEVVRSGLFPGARVARGVCKGVGSQHSWVVLGDPYDKKTAIVDVTLWSYRDDVEGIWRGSGRAAWHRPHGSGSIWKWGRPAPATGEPVELTPSRPLSREARDFLDLLGPLDHEGWAMLAHAPVEGWPAAELVRAMYETESLRLQVPIDIVGMLTDINPAGLYLPA